MPQPAQFPQQALLPCFLPRRMLNTTAANTRTTAAPTIKVGTFIFYSLLPLEAPTPGVLTACASSR